MGTTVFVSPATRDTLNAVKEGYGARSIDETIQRLLRDATPSAIDLFKTHRRKVLAVCKKHGLTTLIAFGSRVRDDRRPTSDLDLVTRFPKGTGLMASWRIQEDLSAAFGCKVDLGTIPAKGTRLAKHIKTEGVVLVAPQP